MLFDFTFICATLNIGVT